MCSYAVFQIRIRMDHLGIRIGSGLAMMRLVKIPLFTLILTP
jgi:hypothetical protein